MPGTRTAPPVDGTGNVRMVSMRFMDVSGDKRAISVEVGIATSAALIEALVAAMAAAVNATLYAVFDTMQYYSPAVATNALAAEENSVYDNIVLLAKSNTNQSEDLFIPTPIRDLFVGDTDNPDNTSAELQAIITAYQAVATGTKVVVAARYTERREKNQSVPAGEI